MPTKYEELYAWAYAAFGDRPFTIADFRATFPSPAPAKVLSDLRRLGFLEPSHRGEYRLVPPEERLRRMTRIPEDPTALLERASLPYAYSDDTAITIWTDGGYWTGFTRGFRPLHLQIRKDDTEKWRGFFREAHARATIEGSRETLFGVAYVLHPRREIRVVKRAGAKVIPVEEAYAYAATKPYLYQPVLQALRRLKRGSRR